MELHHIGYLVEDIEKAKQSFEVLGFSVDKEKIYDPLREADILFLKSKAHCVELISPSNSDSTLYPLLKKYKNMPYHLCFTTEDMEKEIERLNDSGFTQILPQTPAPAIQGKLVVFLMNRHIGIVELVEDVNTGR